LRRRVSVRRWIASGVIGPRFLLAVSIGVVAPARFDVRAGRPRSCASEEHPTTFRSFFASLFRNKYL
jgi:hypothetical protein